MTAYPIDIVVPWVDGSDPAWRKVREQYRPERGNDNDEARFREWGVFQYWFRSIEKYAPWVRKIHLITWGHLPTFLNVNHPKLHIVRHEDYIPEVYRPAFSSHVIELNMHRIEGLAEHFIYFNDDVYLSAPVLPEDFFVDGLAVDTAVMGNVTISDNVSFLPYIQLNMLGNINQTFSKHEVIKRDWKKWFSLKYGKLMLYNLYYYPGVNIAGFRNFHTCIPYCKKTLEDVWESLPDVLDDTSRHRFRSKEDVNQYIFRYWRLMRGEFVPGKPNSRYLTLGEDSVEDVKAALENGRYKVVCVNDDPMSCDFEEERQRLVAAFNKCFSQKSAFEIDGPGCKVEV